jgi:hypothetical protein
MSVGIEETTRQSRDHSPSKTSRKSRDHSPSKTSRKSRDHSPSKTSRKSRDHSPSKTSRKSRDHSPSKTSRKSYKRARSTSPIKKKSLSLSPDVYKSLEDVRNSDKIAMALYESWDCSNNRSVYYITSQDAIDTIKVFSNDVTEI